MFIILSRRRLGCPDWAQCPTCRRIAADGPISLYPQSRCGRVLPVCRPGVPMRCPQTPDITCHGHPTVTCCQPPGKCLPPGGDPCPEHIRPPCGTMPIVNITPNLPPTDWDVTGWRPSPAGVRDMQSSQNPSACLSRACVPCVPCPEPRACDRPCPRLFDGTPRSCAEPSWYDVETVATRCCSPAPAVPWTTCSSIGQRKLVERVQSKYNYPGNESFFCADLANKS